MDWCTKEEEPPTLRIFKGTCYVVDTLPLSFYYSVIIKSVVTLEYNLFVLNKLRQKYCVLRRRPIKNSERHCSICFIIGTESIKIYTAHRSHALLKTSKPTNFHGCWYGAKRLSWKFRCWVVNIYAGTFWQQILTWKEHNHADRCWRPRQQTGFLRLHMPSDRKVQKFHNRILFRRKIKP